MRHRALQRAWGPLCGLFLLGLSARSQTPPRKPVVAVLELQGSEIPPKSLQLWTDLLRTRVIQVAGRQVEVMTAGNQEYLLKANGIDPATVCDGATCDVDLLKNLDADYGFSGNVTRLSSGSYLGTLQFYDTARGSALGAAKLSAPSEAGLITDLEKQGALLCGKLPGLAVSSRSGPPVEEGRLGGGAVGSLDLGAETVFVEFTSEPPGAMVLEAGEPLCQTTPCRKRVAAGRHGFRFALAEHRSEVKEVDVDGTTRGVSASLQPTYALLRVRGVPAGARVTVSGTARTWAELSSGIRLSAGTHEVWLDDPCFVNVGERVVLMEGEERTVSLIGHVLEAALDVRATDGDGNDVEVVIYADGQKVGTNARAVAVPVCVKSVEVEGEGRRRSVDLPMLVAGQRAVAEVRVGGRPTRVEPKTGLVWVDLPEGSFHMGCEPHDTECNGDEKPGRPVSVRAFSLMQTEVTVAAYRRCAAAGKCDAGQLEGDVDERVCNGPNGRESHPMNCVDWSNAARFCRFVGGRLPTAEEWEYASKSGGARTYPWGDEGVTGRRANFCDRHCPQSLPAATRKTWQEMGWITEHANDGHGGTAPVASYQEGDTPWGLKDMAGNVWEWTSTDYDNSKKELRGGSWNYDPRRLRASERIGNDPGNRSSSYGFRCAQ